MSENRSPVPNYVLVRGSRGFAAMFILLIGFAILVVITVTLYTDLLKNNPAVNYLTSPETKNLAVPSPKEASNEEGLSGTPSPSPPRTGSKGLRCTANDDCKSLDYCTDSQPEICYVGKCLIRTCVTETIIY